MMKSSDEYQKSILVWFFTDDPSERKNLAGYKPMLVKKMKRRSKYYKKRSLPQKN